MRSLLIRCYPARWRQRYGDEFLAILEERPLGPYDVADILLGALDARLRSRRADATSTAQGRGLPMSLRVGGVAAISGAVILAVSWFGTISGALPLDGRALVALIFGGLAALLLALTILSAFQARELPRLVWTAFVLAAVGAVGYTVGMITLIGVNEGDVTEGGQTFAAIAYSVGGVAAIVGFALFGIATFRSGVLSRPGAVLLAVGPALAAGAWVVAFTVAWDVGAMVMLAAMVCFLAGWVVLGIAAIRLDRQAPLRSGAA
jgi:hypothetical protein